MKKVKLIGTWFVNGRRVRPNPDGSPIVLPEELENVELPPSARVIEDDSVEGIDMEGEPTELEAGVDPSDAAQRAFKSAERGEAPVPNPDNPMTLGEMARAEAGQGQQAAQGAAAKAEQKKPPVDRSLKSAASKQVGPKKTGPKSTAKK